MNHKLAWCVITSVNVSITHTLFCGRISTSSSDLKSSSLHSKITNWQIDKTLQSDNKWKHAKEHNEYDKMTNWVWQKHYVKWRLKNWHHENWPSDRCTVDDLFLLLQFSSTCNRRNENKTEIQKKDCPVHVYLAVSQTLNFNILLFCIDNSYAQYSSLL